MHSNWSMLSAQIRLQRAELINKMFTSSAVTCYLDYDHPFVCVSVCVSVCVCVCEREGENVIRM